MDKSNVIYIFFLNSLTQLFAILPKKGSHFEKKNEKIIKIYVLDIPKYSSIILYSDN